MAISAAIMGALGASSRLGDPYYLLVALLLHADGANGSTTFTDTSPSPKSVTTVGGSLSTDQAKFGPSSLKCGSGIRYDASLAAIAGDFTAECFVYFGSSPKWATMINLGNGFSGGFLFRQSNSSSGEVYFGSTALSFTFTPSLNTWYHYAVSRIGSTVRLFINGTLIATWTNSFSIPAGVCRLGQSSHQASEVLNGFLDEVRITIGVGRYAATFTPPVLPFKDGT